MTSSGYAINLYGPWDAFLTEISESNPDPRRYISSYLGGENDDDGRALVLLAVNGRGLRGNLKRRRAYCFRLPDSHTTPTIRADTTRRSRCSILRRQV